MMNGIHAIRNALRMGDAQYRRELIRLAGKSSIADLDKAALTEVFEHFRRLQGLNDARV
jgi:phage gp16-like protein